MKWEAMRWFTMSQITIDSLAFLGYPIPFEDICQVYPPKINKILMEKNYPVYRKLLLTSQEDLEDEYTEQKLDLNEMPTPFEYLFEMASADTQIKQIIIDGFNFFINESVTLLIDQKMIIVGDLEKTLTQIKSIEELRIINSDNYFKFQNTLRRALGEKELEAYNPDENSKVRYFKAKARMRDRVKAKSKDSLTLGSTLASICCMGIGLTPLNIGELSQAAVSVLIRYYQEKNKYEIDIQALIAGADSKKVNPQFWIRNLED